MPKATKPKTQSRANPLGPKSSNATKKGPSASEFTKPATLEGDVATESNANSAAETQNADTGEANYLLMVLMTLYTDPMISRTLSLPPNTSFAKFHRVLQIAFGWADCHMHQFTVDIPQAK